MPTANQIANQNVAYNLGQMYFAQSDHFGSILGLYDEEVAFVYAHLVPKDIRSHTGAEVQVLDFYIKQT